jgi:toxin ParE1/3/4
MVRKARRGLGLGFGFLDCVETAVKSILRHPEMYRVVYSGFRGCVVRRFPFSVFYTIEGADVVVHAVFDNRQDPMKRP